MNAPADSQGQLSLETLKRLDAVCAAYESAWQKNNPPRIEEFLGDAGEPERGLIFRELLKLDAELRGKAGLSLATEELRSRFPEYSELITGLESKNIADDATMPPRESPGSEAPASGQTIDTEATPPAGYEDLPFLAPPTKPGSAGRLGHYDIQGIVGRGGMGVVLEAFDEKLHRIVAIKVLGPQFATNASARKRFEREAKAVAAVSHDHIVPIYHVDEFQGVPFLVMPLIVGKSLQDRLDQSGSLELKEILRIGNQIAEGLAAAHKKGLVHRDIKPGNILLENGVERVKITDFGLARAVDDASVTQSGVITGTPMYMAPEQARGEQVDHRADLFSLGSVLYAMCTGHPPFRATGTHAVLMRVIEDTPRSIRESNPELPDWLEDIIAKLHAKKPEERFQTAKEVAELLEQHLAHVQQPHLVQRPAATAALSSPAEPVKILEAKEAQIWSCQISLLVVAVLLLLEGIDYRLFRPDPSNVAGLLLAGGFTALVAAGFVKQRWEAEYRGHAIRVENSIYGAALFIDGVRTAKSGTWLWRELRGVIPRDSAAGYSAEAILKPGLTGLSCRIFVQPTAAAPALAPRPSRPALPMRSRRAVATLKTTDNARPMRPVTSYSPWGRLAWTVAGYGVLVVLLFVFIAAYSDGGWWSTPWIEFTAAPALLLLTIGHLFVRPRWLAVVPAGLGLFMLALGMALWPYSTARHFTRLVREGRFEDANRMLVSGPWDYKQGELDVQVMINGPGVRLTRDDFPLESWDNSWDQYAGQDAIDEFRFTLTSRWVQDCYCELALTAFPGSVRCEGVTYYRNVGLERHKITAAEFAQRRLPKRAAAVAKFPQSATEVLPAVAVVAGVGMFAFHP